MAAVNYIARGMGVIGRHKVLAACGAVAGLIAALLLFIWLVLPSIVKSQAEAFVLRRSGDHLTIGRLTIAPLPEPRLQIDNLRLTQADGSPLLGFSRLAVSISPSSLTRRALVIDEIALDAPQAVVELLPKGRLNWDSLLNPPAAVPTPAVAPPPATASAPPRIVIRKFALGDGQIDLADRRTNTVQSLRLAPLAITLADLSTLPADKRGDYVLTATTSLGARVDWRGTVSLAPLAVGGSLRVEGLSLERLAALLPLPPKLAPPQGTAMLATRYDAGMIGDQLDLTLADLTLGVDGLRLGGKGSPAAITLGHFGVDGGQFDWRRHQLTLRSVTLAGGSVSLRRLADGGIDLLELLSPSPAAPRAAQAASSPDKDIPASPPPKIVSPSATPPAAAWHYRINHVALTGAAVAFRDETVRSPADIALQDIAISVDGVSEDLAAPLPVHLALRARDGGSIAITGKVVPAAPSADLRVQVDALALTPVQPYLGSATVLRLVGGTLSIDGEARYPGDGGTFAGGFAVRDLRIMEGAGRRPFLAWKSLATDSLKVSPSAIAIRELTLDGLDTALAVAKDRSVNVTQILRPERGKPAAAPPRHAAVAKAKTPAASSAAPVIEIERFRIRHSQLDYADASLALPFATHIHDLDGTISRLSTRPGNTVPARLQLAGHVDEDGSASASGRVNLLAPSDLLDIQTAFDNIELTNLTPYLATFAGRRIDSGTLSLHVRYKINHGQLVGDNRIILDRLTLGGRVRSPEARDLPLDFAIALLKDSHGRIDLGIPISGSLQDPQFSYGKLIWKAVSNLLTRIVTSPFRALGSLFGGGGDHDGAIVFAVGEAKLAPAAQKSLQQVAASLAGRPGLAVTLHGTWSDADRPALQEQKLRRALADKLEMPAGADLAAMTPEQGDAAAAMEDLYADRHGKAGLIALKEGYRKVNAGKLDESVGDRALSVVTGLLGRKHDLDETEVAGMKGLDFPAMLHQRLRAEEAVPDDALHKLAHARGEAAAAALHAAAVPADRVSLLAEERVAAVGHDVPLTIALGAASPAPAAP